MLNMKARSKKHLLALGCMAGLALSQTAGALTYTYSFNLIGSPPYESDLSGQLFVDVSAASWTIGAVNHSGVLFNFRNAGPINSAIKEVYFDDGSLLGLAGLIDKDQNFLGAYGHQDVDFTAVADANNFPEGNTVSPPFVTSAGFSAKADAPSGAFKNGVDPKEYLGVVFELLAGKTLQDVIKSLDGEIVDAQGAPALRIGLHIGSIAPGGGSDSYINNGRVPDGGTTMLLLGMSVLGLGYLSRRS